MIFSTPTPIGVIPIAVICGVGIYFWISRLRDSANDGGTLKPIRLELPGSPKVPPSEEHVRSLLSRLRTHDLYEDAVRLPDEEKPSRRAIILRVHPRPLGLVPEPPPPDVSGGKTLLPPTTVSVPARRAFAAAPPMPTGVEMPSAKGGSPGHIVGKPPQGSKGFGWKIAVAFIAMIIPLVLFSRYFFFAYDLGVQSMGSLLYWPLPWPGLSASSTLDHTVADFIFMIYFTYTLAFLLVSGLLIGRGRFTTRQRVSAGIIFATYILASLMIDAILFPIPVNFLESMSLIFRALLGGVFFTLILFATLMKPPPLIMPTFDRRAQGVLTTFIVTLVIAFGAALLLLYFLWTDLGLDRGNFLDVQLRLIVFLPLLTYTFWAIEGRVVYALELRRYPPVSLESYHPDVTVIIPAFNEEVCIQECISCADAAARSYPGRTEILVGNDGSTDRTSELAHAQMKKLRWSKGYCIDLPHGGKSSALNGALAHAKGDIVIRVDSDSFISPAWGFAALIGHMANPRVGGVQGMILPLQREGWIRKMRMLEIVWRHMFLFRALMGTRTLQVVDGGFSVFRRRDLITLGGWVAWNGEDCEITLRLQRAGYTMRYEPKGLTFEDVPGNLRELKKQRVRWNRGGFFAHARHYGAFFSGAPEYGGLAMLYWLTLYARGGLRYMGIAYIVLTALVFHLFTFYVALLIVAFILLPKGLAMTYYLVKLKFYDHLLWILSWPVTSALKQYFSVEAWGTIFPGAMPEFSE